MCKGGGGIMVSFDDLKFKGPNQRKERIGGGGIGNFHTDKS